MEVNTKYLFKQSFLIYLFAYLTAPFSYFIKILYARQFSIEEFGLIYSIIGVISLISIFNDFGFSETISYYAIRFYEKKQYAKVKASLLFAFIMQFSTASLLVIFFYFLSPFLVQYYFKTEIAISTFRWFLFYFLFYNITVPFTSLFSAMQRYHVSKLTSFLRFFIIFLFSMLILIFPSLKNLDYIGFVWGGSSFILFIFFYLYSKKKFPNIFSSKAYLTFSLFKKLFKYAIMVVSGVGATLLLSRIDIVLLTYFKTLQDVGLYSIALSLASILSILTGPILSMVFPLTSKLIAGNEFKKIKEFLTLIYSFGLYLIIPLFIIFVSYPNEIIKLFFGDKYVAAALTFIILSMFYFISFFSNLNINIMGGCGDVKERVKIMYCAAGSNIIFDLILIPIYGIVGAAFGTLLSICIKFLLSYIFIKSKININLSKIFFIKLFITNLGVLILVTFLKKIISTNFIIEALVITIIVFSIYGIIGYYWKIVDFKKFFNFFKLKNFKKDL